MRSFRSSENHNRRPSRPRSEEQQKQGSRHKKSVRTLCSGLALSTRQTEQDMQLVDWNKDYSHSPPSQHSEALHVKNDIDLPLEVQAAESVSIKWNRDHIIIMEKKIPSGTRSLGNTGVVTTIKSRPSVVHSGAEFVQRVVALKVVGEHRKHNIRMPISNARLVFAQSAPNLLKPVNHD